MNYLVNNFFKHSKLVKKRPLSSEGGEGNDVHLRKGLQTDFFDLSKLFHFENDVDW